MFICSVILLFITILLLTRSFPLKAIVFILLVEIFIPYLEVILSSLCVKICSASSELTTIMRSENISVLMSLVLEIVIPFISSFFYYVII